MVILAAFFKYNLVHIKTIGPPATLEERQKWAN